MNRVKIQAFIYFTDLPLQWVNDVMYRWRDKQEQSLTWPYLSYIGFSNSILLCFVELCVLLSSCEANDNMASFN